MCSKRGKFAGKVLLLLGSSVGSVDIVNYAKANGAYTIVADYLPTERSSAKLVADESVLISTADLEALGKLVKERHIDGVFAGIHEFNLLQAMTLCEKYHLPFYCTRAQWDLIQNKAQFRSLCVKYCVPCPETWYTGDKIPDDIWRQLRYPVIVKPVDSCNSVGISICYSEAELRKDEALARENSGCGQIILEEFVKGAEFTAHYTICGGRPTLSCVDNRYPVAVHEGQVTTIPAGRIYPSLFTQNFIEQVNEPMLRLCKGIGLWDGVLFIQGMYDSEVNEFHIFEAGLRSAGEAPYRFIEKVNGINYIHVLVDHALLGAAEFGSDKEDPLLKGKCCSVVSFVAKGGRVGAIEGLEAAVQNTPSVTEYESRYPVGVDTPNTDSLRQLMIRFVMICSSREQMKKDVEYLNNAVTVLNDKGENMVVKLNPERI